jgi:hypothetical protein
VWGGEAVMAVKGVGFGSRHCHAGGPHWPSVFATWCVTLTRERRKEQA